MLTICGLQRFYHAKVSINVYAANMKGCVFTSPSLIVKADSLIDESLLYKGGYRDISPNNGRIIFARYEARKDGSVYRDFYVYKPQKGDGYLLLKSGGSQRNCRRYIDYVEIREKE